MAKNTPKNELVDVSSNGLTLKGKHYSTMDSAILELKKSTKTKCCRQNE
jgi:hypothetical protein